MEVQQNLGADIAMAFDECPPLPGAARGGRGGDRAHHALGAPQPRRAPREPTRRCSASCRAACTSTCASRARARSRASDFPGYAHRRALRGRAEDGHAARARAARPPAARRQAALPDGRRHAGGPPRGGGARGRHVRLRAAHAQRAQRPALHARGRLSIRNARYRADPRPPDPACACYTCRTREPRLPAPPPPGADEMSAATLMTIHNLPSTLTPSGRSRQSIRLGRFEEFRAEMLRTRAPAPEARRRLAARALGPDRQRGLAESRFNETDARSARPPRPRRPAPGGEPPASPASS